MTELPINQIICGDAIKEMKKLPDEYIDLIVTDPPYDVGKGKWDTAPMNWVEECYRVLKKGGHFYSFYSCLHIPRIQTPIEKYFTVKNIIVWNPQNSVCTYDKTRWAFKWQPIIFATKGKSEIKIASRYPSRWSTNDVISDVPTLMFNQKLHPVEKPPKLLKRLIFVSSNENDVVLDPFVGSGATCVAARMLNRRYIGVDNNPEYIEIAKKRLANIPPPLEAFA